MVRVTDPDSSGAPGYLAAVDARQPMITFLSSKCWGKKPLGSRKAHGQPDHTGDEIAACELVKPLARLHTLGA